MIEAWLAAVAGGGTAVAVAMAASLVATAVAAVGAWRRRAGVGRRLLIVALSLAAWLSLWLTLIPPRVAVPAGEVVLVTPGATVAELASAGGLADVFVLDEALANPSLAAAVDARAGAVGTALTKVVTLPDDIALHRNAPRGIRVIGSGIAPAQWRDSTYAGAVGWDAEPAIAGVTAIEWPRQIAPGEPLTVSLTVTSGDAGPYRLDDPFGEALDESAAVDGDVRLAAASLPPGRHVLGVRGGDAQAARPVPVEVVAPVPARVLMLQSGPSFEWRALQRWVADSGAPLAVRTRISRDRFRSASANREGGEIERLDAATLDDVDLVIADAREWSAIDAGERDAIMTSVTRDGVGLLLLLRDVESPGDVNTAFGDTVVEPVSTTTEAGLATAVTAGLPADLRLSKAPYRIVGGAAPLLSAADGRSLAASSRRGAGRIAVMLLLDTYRLVTPGFETQFAALWQSLVGAIARPDDSAQFETHPQLPTAGWRTRLCVAGGNGDAELAVRDAAGSVALPLVPSRWLPGRRCAWFFPRTPGWHELRAGDDAGAVYVFAESDWRELRLAERVRATRSRIARGAPGEPDGASVARPVPRQWLFPFAVLFASLLWLEQKLAGRGRPVSRRAPSRAAN